MLLVERVAIPRRDYGCLRGGNAPGHNFICHPPCCSPLFFCNLVCGNVRKKQAQLSNPFANIYIYISLSCKRAYILCPWHTYMPIYANLSHLLLYFFISIHLNTSSSKNCQSRDGIKKWSNLGQVPSRVCHTEHTSLHADSKTNPKWHRHRMKLGWRLLPSTGHQSSSNLKSAGEGMLACNCCESCTCSGHTAKHHDV